LDGRVDCEESTRYAEQRALRKELGVFRYTAEGWQISSLDEAADARYRDYQQDQTPAADHAAAARAVVCLSFTSSE
jgi:hypothetical protein